MDASISRYIAGEAARRYGPIEDDLPRKLQRNIRRKYKVTVPRDEVMSVARHFKAIYSYAASVLPKYLRPPRGRYVEMEDVRLEPFLAAIQKKFPQDDPVNIELVAGYVVFYEYLK